MIYVGTALDHAPDVYWFFNPSTKQIIESRDVQWLGQTYGEWSGRDTPSAPGTVVVPPVPDNSDDGAHEIKIKVEPDQEKGQAAPAPAPAPAPPPKLSREMQNLAT